MISWMIRPPCEITDQLAIGTQNCFSTLFYTPYTNIKTSTQNAPKCTIARQKIKKFSGEGARPLPRPLPHGGRGYPLPRPYPPRFSRLRRLNRRSRFFSFTTQTLYINKFRGGSTCPSAPIAGSANAGLNVLSIMCLFHLLMNNETSW